MSTVYDILTILPLSLLSLLLFGGYAGIPENSLPGYALCAVFTVWCILLRHMQQKNRLRCIGIVAAFVIGLLLAVGEENRETFIGTHIWMLWVIGCCAAALAIGFAACRSIWVRRAVTAALLTYSILAVVRRWEIGKAAAALIALLLLLEPAEEIQRQWHKSGCPDLKTHITSVAPVFLVVCMTVFCLPAPAEPYDWHAAKQLWQRAEALFTRAYGYAVHRSDDYNAAGSVGFSDSGGFLSGLGDNDSEVLRITATNASIRHFKLVGCMSGDFTGREWVFRTEPESTFRMTDTLESYCAVRKFDSEAPFDYLQKTDMQYETRFYNTRYLFSPAKIRIDAAKKSIPGITEKNGSIFSDHRLNYQDTYTLSCYVLNDSHPKLAELLTDAAPITEQEWIQAANAENVLHTKGYSYADYQQCRAEIYDTFCRAHGLSEKAAAVLHDIEAQAGSRYEALKLLEAYLRRLEYSTNPGALPEDVTDAASFLDHFLFSSQKGYCMHFATAFVLMAQEMGIPCRYVQGYYVRRNADGELIVKQSSAHAWPEAYFDNVGWVAFEPTPCYSDPMGWDTEERNPYIFTDTTAPDSAEETAEPEDGEQAHEDGTGFRPVLLLIPVLAAVCFVLLYYLLIRAVSRRSYRQMENNEKYRCLTQRCLRMLDCLGCGMAEGETLAEYQRRMMQTDSAEIRECLSFLPIYETMLYSDRDITAEEIRTAEQSEGRLRAIVKQRSLRIRLRLLLGKQSNGTP